MLVDFGKDDKSWINDPEQIKRDQERQNWLESQGYKVIRFSNEQIFFDTENVINIIKSNLSLQGRI